MNVILNLVKRLLEYSESEQQSDQNHHCDQTNAQHARLRSETHLDFFFPFYLFNFFFFLRRQSRTVVFRWILKSVNWVPAQFYRQQQDLETKNKTCTETGECLNAMGIVGLKGKQFFQFFYIFGWFPFPFSQCVCCEQQQIKQFCFLRGVIADLAAFYLSCLESGMGRGTWGVSPPVFLNLFHFFFENAKYIIINYLIF